MGDYGKTLQLPKTGFPMKANLPTREPERLKAWGKPDLYQEIRKHRADQKKFVLHDGPPYANGEIHMGHVLNKTLKDIVVRTQAMHGNDVPFVPGWDCHGLPIEHALLKEMGKRKEQVERVAFRKAARKYAEKYIDIQRESFKRLGILAEWEKPYLTMDYDYQATIADAFLELFEKGFIERRLKPVPWCWECETALADAELEYENKTSDSITVKFPVESDGRPTSVLVWTTTPWTLPANVGLAFHPKLTYVRVEVGQEDFILAQDLLEALGQKLGFENPKVAEKLSGKQVASLSIRHPFLDRASKGLLADFVSSEEGTGVVHIAPGHGEEDYQAGHLQNKLDVLSPVDAKGEFTEEFAPCKGEQVFKANAKIVQILKKQKTLVGAPTPYEHSYPHCWRCKQPIIFRATRQWFLKVDHQDLRDKALKAVQKAIQFHPSWGVSRIKAMLETRPDWCLSRQRYWGVPIPIVNCESCGQVARDEQFRAKVVELFKAQGADSWFEEPVESFLKASPTCCQTPKLVKEEDIIDVWFDSGVSHRAVLASGEARGLKFPADLYLEGSDQHRGWFQTSLLASIGLNGTSPFESVLTHGFVVDGEGRKMSKSLGNVIDPKEVLKKYGADILRLWVASCDYAEDVRVSNEILEQTSETYRKIRNTFRFLLGNLADFDPKKDQVDVPALLPVDQWALWRTGQLVKEVTAAFEAYEFHRAIKAVSQFCIVDLSNFYLDILKDRLYTYAANDPARRSAQTVLHAMTHALLKCTAPVLVFTAEEAWENFSFGKEASSVHLSDWPDPKMFSVSIDEKQWAAFFKLRETTLKALEEKRTSGTIGNSLEGSLTLTFQDRALEPLKEFFSELLVVSVAEGILSKGKGPEVGVEVRRAQGEKCQRCWRYPGDVGSDSKHPGICQRCVRAVEAVDA